MAAMARLALTIVSLVAAWLGRRFHRRRLPAQAVIVSPKSSTSIARDGAVRSVQSAELTMSQADLDRLWNVTNLENLARTYWRFLSRVTFGLIRVVYGENERCVVFLARPFTMLRFEAPEYSVAPDHGGVRWRIRDGVLVARAGRGSGFLAIDIKRLAPSPELPHGSVKLLIDVEVANFYPSIAANFSTPVYQATQSLIHVFVTHGFLRSLARLDLARSKVGRLALPAPAPAAPPVAAATSPLDGSGGQPTLDGPARPAAARQP
jgi:hypothetical protein